MAVIPPQTMFTTDNLGDNFTVHFHFFFWTSLANVGLCLKAWSHWESRLEEANIVFCFAVPILIQTPLFKLLHKRHVLQRYEKGVGGTNIYFESTVQTYFPISDQANKLLTDNEQLSSLFCCLFFTFTIPQSYHTHTHILSVLLPSLSSLGPTQHAQQVAGTVGGR